MNVLLTKVNRVPSVEIVPRRDKKHSDRGYYLNSTDIKIKEYIKRRKKPYIMVNPQVRLLLDGKNDKNKIIENVEYARTNCFICSKIGIGIKIVRRVRTNGMCRCIGRRGERKNQKRRYRVRDCFIGRLGARQQPVIPHNTCSTFKIIHFKEHLTAAAAAAATCVVDDLPGRGKCVRGKSPGFV